jgi:hypothetical protein
VNEESMRAWLAFVHAEQVYREAMGELRNVDLEQVLREGLGHLPWRRQALAVLRASNVAFSVRLLPQLFELAAVSHALLGSVRECILRIPRDDLETQFPSLVDALIADPQSDYEAYRRTAELLRLLEMPELLGKLVNAASRSSDSDIREVAEDFKAIE